MSKTILVCGHGPGISSAVARKFGAEGFAVALVARNRERLEEAVRSLAAAKVNAAAFSADLADPANAKRVVEEARAKLGPIAVIHWNAYVGAAGDLLATDVAGIRTALDVATTSLVVAVQTALADLRAAGDGAVLVTNGGFGLVNPQSDGACVQFNCMGLGLANAAKDKLVGMLSKRLETEKVYVGQIMVMSTVKGTAFDRGNGTIDPKDIAERFFTMYRERRDVRATAA